MRKVLLALMLAVAACSPNETVNPTTTTTSTSDTSVTSEPVTTMSPATTTTTSPRTTTTSTATTTTSRPTSTTTAEPLEGNWADGPLVTTDFGALGWWDGSDWRDAETEGALPVVGGEDYQTVRLGEVGRTTAGPQTTVCETLGLIGVRLADPELLGEYYETYGVAVSAPWAVQPFLFEEASDDGTYAEFASEWLASRGLEVPEPVIKEVFRTDLEGDGVEEVLVVAEEVTAGYLMQPGDYSIAFLRTLVDGEVQTAILGDTVVVDESGRFSGAHFFGGVADLNGDRKMEIITNAAFFEGFNVTIWEYIDDDIGPVIALETGCGS